MKAARTWVVVADAGRCKVFDRKTADGSLKSVLDDDLVGTIQSAARSGSDRPGMTYESAGMHRHAKVPHTDPREQAEASFASEVADYLQREASNFDRLIVAAAPSFLGHLRTSLSPAVSALVTHEIHKDFTNLSEPDLAKSINRSLDL